LMEHGGGDNSSSAVVVPPQSDANLSWFTQSQARAIENGTHSNTNIPVEAAIKLRKMARMEPRYERNLAKLCSFYARGECNRGNNCPFRHEMPKDRNDPLSKQNTKDRFYGTNDPVAEKIIYRNKERMEARKAEAFARNGADVSTGSPADDGTTIMGTTLYCRFGENANFLSITENDVRDQFYSFGEITSMRFTRDRKSIFVEYTSRSATELAIVSKDRCTIGGSSCHVSWARAPKRGSAGTGLGGSNLDGYPNRTNMHNGPIRPIAAPGASTNSPKLMPGFAPLRPSAEVLAAATAKRNASGSYIPSGGANKGVTKPSLSSTTRLDSVGLGGVPTPGGGVIRGASRKASEILSRMAANSSPYYPSQNPGRLGSHGR